MVKTELPDRALNCLSIFLSFKFLLDFLHESHQCLTVQFPGATHGLFFHLDCCSLEYLSSRCSWFSLVLNYGTNPSQNWQPASIFFLLSLPLKPKASQQIFSSSMTQVKNMRVDWHPASLNALGADRAPLLSVFSFIHQWLWGVFCFERKQIQF